MLRTGALVAVGSPGLACGIVYLYSLVDQLELVDALRTAVTEVGGDRLAEARVIHRRVLDDHVAGLAVLEFLATLFWLALGFGEVDMHDLVGEAEHFAEVLRDCEVVALLGDDALAVERRERVRRHLDQHALLVDRALVDETELFLSERYLCHGVSFRLVDEHFDAVECGRLRVEHAAERLEVEIGVDLGEEHLAAGIITADSERTVATELVLLGDLDGLHLLLLLVDKAIIPRACAHVHTYFQINRKSFRRI